MVMNWLLPNIFFLQEVVIRISPQFIEIHDSEESVLSNDKTFWYSQRVPTQIDRI